ncbi:homeobox-DDT domain protein RLT1 [Physcomitrium patens]|uniref:Homeobox domain-containing protein n=1 Tax=Physcomitrium patens TaxID=3218 RepID=A0A2K1K3Q1_PHYPA|nr:homeobox-DDT domain protein RLT1-like [Physcomitrium patens]XP_024384482.1 homeobox-DDT domain protein RLT1-like [Physcomitrium patens]PNR48399.1 hypothetical protein PHYPA_012875 [Physcomitrium patens]|eukprot:XP_024384481.1 homeobox-DDT domain protein RLT1-like [Physcomitrella patens]
MASDGSSPHTSPAPSPPEKPKGISRKKKSASQTEVLERAYAVEKYPSEATRKLLGRELDLSDKQLQIWFTHRRYKDRRDGIDDEKLTFYAKNKTQDHMSTQECRSSKKEEIDQHMIEEDSEPDGYPARVLAEERDDDELIAEHEHTNGMDAANNGGYGELEKVKPGPKRRGGPRVPKDPNRPPRRPGPKPKFNAMAAAERQAIIAVESQLCGPLREDGPPLGFEFDPLPPRAFTELPITEVPHNAGVSRDGGSESYSERTALQNKWTKEVEITDNKKRKIGGLQTSGSQAQYSSVHKPSRGENGY